MPLALPEQLPFRDLDGAIDTLGGPGTGAGARWGGAVG
jgi:hypothetical protein